MGVNIRQCMYACMYVYVYMYVCIYMHVYVYVCMCMYVYVFMHVCMNALCICIMFWYSYLEYSV